MFGKCKDCGKEISYFITDPKQEGILCVPCFDKKTADMQFIKEANRNLRVDHDMSNDKLRTAVLEHFYEGDRGVNQALLDIVGER